MRESAALAPLTEILPAAPGDGAAATGFALAWIACAASGLVFWSSPDFSRRDTGVPYAEGLSQLGVSFERLILVDARNQIDALWATEEALSLPGAFALCTIMPAAKPLSLAATRRLLLAAEKNASHCVLLRFDETGASAAWTRWRITAAPSRGEARELGAPAFSARLERNRAGPSGLSWGLVWDVCQHGFTVIEEKSRGAMDVDPSAAPVDRPAETARAGAA